MVTCSGPAPFQRNVILHWSFTRILNVPFLSPLRASRRFPGGTRRESRDTAASSWWSFLFADLWIRGSSFGTGSRRKTSSVSRFPNDWIPHASTLPPYATTPFPHYGDYRQVDAWVTESEYGYEIEFLLSRGRKPRDTKHSIRPEGSNSARTPDSAF